MQKLHLTSDIVDKFYEFVRDFFKSASLQKNEKKAKWTISLDNLNKIIAKKLRTLNIQDLESLVKADFATISKIKNQKIVLTKKEKDYFYTMYAKLKKAEFIEMFNIKVCPYCNRNYIFNFNKGSSKEATAQLDHFFDKSSNPILSISVYNLVPSCSVCNQRKSKRNVEIFYPYEESFNDNAKFTYDGIKSTALLKNKRASFFDEERIKFDIHIKSEPEKAKNHIDVFNIKNLYQNHRDIISEIIKKSIIYNDSYKTDLLKNHSNLFKNEQELIELIFCTYLEDRNINQRPLSKLTKDILEQLEII